jgi:hypothetical protein
MAPKAKAKSAAKAKPRAAPKARCAAALDPGSPSSQGAAHEKNDIAKFLQQTGKETATDNEKKTYDSYKALPLRCQQKNDIIAAWKNDRTCQFIRTMTEKHITSSSASANSKYGWLTAHLVAKELNMDVDSELCKNILADLPQESYEKWDDTKTVEAAYKKQKLMRYYWDADGLSDRKETESFDQEITSASAPKKSKHSIADTYLSEHGLAKVTVIHEPYVNLCSVAKIVHDSELFANKMIGNLKKMAARFNALEANEEVIVRLTEVSEYLKVTEKLEMTLMTCKEKMDKFKPEQDDEIKAFLPEAELCKDNAIKSLGLVEIALKKLQCYIDSL